MLKTHLLSAAPAWVISQICDADLHFAEQRAFCRGGQNAIDQLISCSRASTEYAQWADGHWSSFEANTPAITDLGLWIWESSTNLVTYAIPDSHWIYQHSGIASDPTYTVNYGAAPDGTLTATRIQFALNGGTTSSDYSQIATPTGISHTSGTPQTGSYFLKTNDGSSKVMTLTMPDGSQISITVTGTWNRLALTHTPSSTSSSTFRLRLRGSEGTADSADILVWIAQVENKSFATPPILTTGSAATRAADVISLIGSSATVALSAQSAFIQTYGVAGGTSALRLLDFSTGGAFFGYPTISSVRIAGTASLDAIMGTGGWSGIVKTAAIFNSSGTSIVSNGGTVASNASAWGFNTGTPIIGNRAAGDRALNGAIQRMAFSGVVQPSWLGFTTP